MGRSKRLKRCGQDTVRGTMAVSIRDPPVRPDIGGPLRFALEED